MATPDKSKQRTIVPPEVLEPNADISQMRVEIEELVSLVSQVADSSNNRLVIRFEEYELRQEMKFEKMMSFVKWFIGIAVIMLSFMVPVFYMSFDKVHSDITEIVKKHATNETEHKDYVSRSELAATFEKRMAALESKVGETITHKDLSQMKTEIVDWILKVQREGKVNAK
jgi:hypothetical protein